MIPFLTAEQIRAWDRFTIEKEPISSFDLMERAASNCIPFILKKITFNDKILIVCGSGNNGGVGLVIARKLLILGYNVHVKIIKLGKLTDDANKNLISLPEEIFDICDVANVPVDFIDFSIVIDAIFGTGLKRPVVGHIAEWINALNAIKAHKIAVDVPSGLLPDQYQQSGSIFKADITLTFQAYKKAFLYNDLIQYYGVVEKVDIGLSKEYLDTVKVDAYAVDSINLEVDSDIYSHKYKRGFLTVYAGSPQMLGARILVVKGGQAVGVGLVSVGIEEGGDIPVAEALTFSINENKLNTIWNPKTTAVVCGPGLGGYTSKFVDFLNDFRHCPVLFDADALSYLSSLKDYTFPISTVLTPHDGELKKLIGGWDTEDDKILKVISFVKQHSITIVLKGYHTKVIDKCGVVYKVLSGNPLLASAGSGDVLSGMIGGLLAKNYSPTQASICGVYLHGKAADLFNKKFTGRFMKANDLFDYVKFSN